MSAGKPSASVLKRLAKLLGKKAYWELRKDAPTPEQRAEFKAQLPELRGIKAMARERMERRRAELLQDPEYQRLKQASIDADKASEHASGMSCFLPISIGTNEGMFFRVAAQGDTWDEVLAEVEAKRSKS